jgi:hypothetical protein
MSIGFPELILILAILILFSLVYVIPFWRILKRTGYNPALSFIALIPIVKLVALYYFAFATWPNDSQSKKTE